MVDLNHGSFVISLDFEMMWGCCEWSSPEGYGRTNVANVPEVIRRMLALFHQYGVHATFATVGMIMLKDRNEAIKMIPEKKPSYHRISASPYANNYIQQIKQEHENMFFARDQVIALNSDTNVEVGTHTYSHYYCLEPGQTLEEFESDIQKGVETANSVGISVKSIVFPKNQVSDEYLKICAMYGITSYRGNAHKFYNEPKNKCEAIKNRICRLVDAYINVGGMTSVPYDKLEVREGVLNVRASRMLRPYSTKLFFLEGLRLRRIRKELIYAAMNGEMYHLWWHPHNFGSSMDENFRFLENVLKIYKDCNERYGMQSLTMKEMKELLVNQ